MRDPESNRREFLHAGAVAAAAVSSGLTATAATEQPARNDGGIPLRQFGKNGPMVSAMALGGHASTNPQKMSEAESLRLIQRAVDEGVTFMDNCWDYHDGLAEERMGKALAAAGRRDKVFLMTKVCGRTAKDARSNLEQSLKRLQTDHLDLWMFHEIVYDNDPDWIFESGGAFEAGLEALQQGKVRHLGFTGHKDPSIHLKMLSKPFDWAAVLMPLNVMDVHYRSFQKQVLPELNRRQIAPLGMKSLGGNGSIVSGAGISPQDAIRYVLSLPICTLVSGIDSEKVLDQNLDIVRRFTPMTELERTALERKTLRSAGDGRFELFKSSKAFDGAVHRKQHGFSTELS